MQRPRATHSRATLASHHHHLIKAVFFNKNNHKRYLSNYYSNIVFNLRFVFCNSLYKVFYSLKDLAIEGFVLIYNLIPYPLLNLIDV